MLSEAGARGRVVCRQPGPQSHFGVPRSPASNRDHSPRSRCGRQCRRGKQDGKHALAGACGSVQHPLAPPKRSQGGRHSPGCPEWPCASQTAQACVPSMRSPGDARASPWGLGAAGSPGVVLLPHWDHLRFPLREARAPSHQTGGRLLGPKSMLW